MMGLVYAGANDPVEFGNASETTVLIGGIDGVIISNMSNTLYVNGTQGKVGIRTTSPASTLHIVHPDTVNTSLILDGGRTTGGSQVLFTNSYWVDSNKYGMGAIEVRDSGISGGDMYFKTTTNGGGTSGEPSTKVFIQDNGNTGIGTTSPNQTLSVAGTGYFSGDVYIAGTLTGGSPMKHGKDPDSAEHFNHTYDFSTDCYWDYDGVPTLSYYKTGQLVTEYNSSYCEYYYEKSELYDEVKDKQVITEEHTINYVDEKDVVIKTEIKNKTRKVMLKDLKHIDGKWQLIKPDIKKTIIQEKIIVEEPVIDLPMREFNTSIMAEPVYTCSTTGRIADNCYRTSSSGLSCYYWNETMDKESYYRCTKGIWELK